MIVGSDKKVLKKLYTNYTLKDGTYLYTIQCCFNVHLAKLSLVIWIFLITVLPAREIK